MTIDHSRAIRYERYAAKKRARIEAAAKREGSYELIVSHDADGACCRREPWAATLARLVGSSVAAAAQRSPGAIAATLREHEPAIIIVRGDADRPR